MMTPWNELLYSWRPFRGTFAFPVGRRFFRSNLRFQQQSVQVSKKRGNADSLYMTQQFVSENASLVENKAATYGIRKDFLKRSPRVEQVIPSYQHPPISSSRVKYYGEGTKRAIFKKKIVTAQPTMSFCSIFGIYTFVFFSFLYPFLFPQGVLFFPSRFYRVRLSCDHDWSPGGSVKVR